MLAASRLLVAARKKYKWPLTMTTADVGDTLLSGAFQYLPPLPQDLHTASGGRGGTCNELESPAIGA